MWFIDLMLCVCLDTADEMWACNVLMTVEVASEEEGAVFARQEIWLYGYKETV